MLTELFRNTSKKPSLRIFIGPDDVSNRLHAQYKAKASPIVTKWSVANILSKYNLSGITGHVEMWNLTKTGNNYL